MSICRDCGSAIKWFNRKPYDLKDGSIHWDVCRERQYEAAKKYGRPYKTENESGFVGTNGVRWPLQKKGPLIVGPNFKNDLCDCGLPPWEICKEDCSHQIQK